MSDLPESTLGKSGLEVSVIGAGLRAAGDHWGPTDDKLAMSAIDASIDAVINFFDTADVYGDHYSENLLGKAMRRCREKFIVATKIGWRGYGGERTICRRHG